MLEHCDAVDRMKPPKAIVGLLVALTLLAAAVVRLTAGDPEPPVVVRSVGDYEGAVPDRLSELSVEVERVAQSLAGYAGVTVQPDYRVGGRVYVGWTSDVEKKVRLVQSRVSAPELVRGFRANFTLAELEAAESELSALLMAQRGTGGPYDVRWVTLAINESMNRVELVVFATPELATEVQQRFGDKVALRFG